MIKNKSSHVVLLSFFSLFTNLIFLSFTFTGKYFYTFLSQRKLGHDSCLIHLLPGYQLRHIYNQLSKVIHRLESIEAGNVLNAVSGRIFPSFWRVFSWQNTDKVRWNSTSFRWDRQCSLRTCLPIKIHWAVLKWREQSRVLNERCWSFPSALWLQVSSARRCSHSQSCRCPVDVVA